MSGLSHTPGKRARGKTLRGFESRLLRQRQIEKRTLGVRFFLLAGTFGHAKKGSKLRNSPSPKA